MLNKCRLLFACMFPGMNLIKSHVFRRVGFSLFSPYSPTSLDKQWRNLRIRLASLCFLATMPFSVNICPIIKIVLKFWKETGDLKLQRCLMWCQWNKTLESWLGLESQLCYLVIRSWLSVPQFPCLSVNVNYMSHIGLVRPKSSHIKLCALRICELLWVLQLCLLLMGTVTEKETVFWKYPSLTDFTKTTGMCQNFAKK